MKTHKWTDINRAMTGQMSLLAKNDEQFAQFPYIVDGTKTEMRVTKKGKIETKTRNH